MKLKVEKYPFAISVNFSEKTNYIENISDHPKKYSKFSKNFRKTRR